LAFITTTDTLSVSVSGTSSVVVAESDLYRTQRGLYAGPAPYVVLDDKAIVTVFDLFVSDTLPVQWLEEPVDENEIISADALRVSLTFETSQLLNHIGVTDNVTTTLSETISLLQSGVTAKTASDTVSVSMAESVTVNVTLAITDTVSVSLTDTSSLLTPAQFVAVTDTLSVSLTEDTPLLGIFTGILDILSADIVQVGFVESAVRDLYVPPVEVRPFRIRIIPRSARIRIIAQ
jgi:hypothetical protein